MGTLAPDGKSYRPSHIIASLKPIPPIPKVSFEVGGTQGRSEMKGLYFLPTGAMSALYNRLGSEGLSEPEIAAQLTHDIGGDPLQNAQTAQSTRDDSIDHAFEDTKRRLSNIDLAHVDSQPRPAPFLTPAQMAPPGFPRGPLQQGPFRTCSHRLRLIPSWPMAAFCLPLLTRSFRRAALRSLLLPLLRLTRCAMPLAPLR